MKKWILLILAIILFGIFSLIRSCQRSSREVINVYTDKEIEYFIGKFAKKFERNEKIMVEEIKNFLMIKVLLLYMAPLLLTGILSVVGTALTTIFYFLIFFISLLYCFYSFIKIENNPLNSTFYISVYLLQYIFFIFIILHF